MRKWHLLMIFILVIISINSTFANTLTKMIQVTYRNISILVNGKQIQSDKEPFIYQGSVFAPLRTIGEAVDKNVEWDNKTNQVNITDKEPTSLCFPIHKIGERVYMHPYAITINKVYTGFDKDAGMDTLFIDISLECYSKGEKTFINQDLLLFGTIMETN